MKVNMYTKQYTNQKYQLSIKAVLTWLICSPWALSIITIVVGHVERPFDGYVVQHIKLRYCSLISNTLKIDRTQSRMIVLNSTCNIYKRYSTDINIRLFVRRTEEIKCVTT